MMAGGQPRPAEAELQHTEVEVVVKSLSVSFNNADKDLFRYRYAVPVAYKPVIHIKKSFLVKKNIVKTTKQIYYSFPKSTLSDIFLYCQTNFTHWIWMRIRIWIRIRMDVDANPGSRSVSALHPMWIPITVNTYKQTNVKIILLTFLTSTVNTSSFVLSINVC